MPKKPKKRISLDEAVDKLAAIVESHLATLPEEEQEARVNALSRGNF
jgi:hypothetical protein